MKVHHIGIKVSQLEKNIELYSKLGCHQVSPITVDDIQNNKIVFLYNQFQCVELIEPLDEKSSIFHFKDGYHHICYEADEDEDIITAFKEAKIGKIFTKPIVAPALENREVVFACLQNGMFIELIL